MTSISTVVSIQLLIYPTTYGDKDLRSYALLLNSRLTQYPPAKYLRLPGLNPKSKSHHHIQLVIIGNIYVSNPARGGGLHNYGLAVDLSILDENGKPLSMGTPVDYLGKEAHITEEAQLVAQGKITAQERGNRLLLRQIMKEAGFRPLPNEWWHFNRCSRQTAKEKYQIIP